MLLAFDKFILSIEDIMNIKAVHVELGVSSNTIHGHKATSFCKPSPIFDSARFDVSILEK
ncbi:MAG: hypothetical protein LBI78_04310 [Campylobacteraceae bacterium]|jgi:hypothetical protein|nr:hypothetical protein [Campylobacteraceae bacterium]